jgi:O-acetyl-ADP-ribose deacetylase (regulator of RNase III)
MSETLFSHTFPGGQQFLLVQGDLTQEPVDAIINAANSQLQHDGGVAGVISRAGGPIIKQESDAWVRQHGPVSHAHPAYTSAGRLPQKYVIHAVGPVWGSGEEDRKLAEAVTGSLRVAEELKLTSLAFPAISTGIFGFPKQRAAEVIYQAVHDFFTANPNSPLVSVRLALYDQPTVEVFSKVWKDFHQDK